MAKKPAVPVVPASIQSLRDAGFQQGKNVAQFADIVRFAMDRIPTLGDPSLDRSDQIDKDSKAELREGYMTYYHESVKPSRFFLIVDNNLVEKTETEWNETEGYEKRMLNVHVAFGMTQAAMNALKEDSPNYHALVQEVKTDFNAYVSNRLGDLIRKAKELRAKALGLKRERAPTKVFTDWESETLESILTRVKTADTRGMDPTADVERVKRAIAAYKSVA